MYLKIDDNIYQKIKNVTGIDYDKEGDMLNASEIINIIEDLLDQYDSKKEEYDDLKLDLENNYKPISKEEMYDFDYRN